MPRQLFLYRNGEWIEAEKAAPKHQSYLISDNLNDVWNPMTNKRYSSKSRYYAETKAHGGEIMGNDPAGLRKEHRSSRPAEAAGHALYRKWHELGGD